MAIQHTFAKATCYALVCGLLFAAATTATHSHPPLRTRRAEQSVRLETIDGSVILHLPAGQSLKVQFHDENGTMEGAPQAIALEQDLLDLKQTVEEMKVALREEFSEKLNSLTTSLQEETVARTKADGAEAQTRSDEDIALKASVYAEMKTRTSEDLALKGSLTTETTTRTTADSALSSSLVAESKLRITGDASITASVKPLTKLNLNMFMRKIYTIANPGRNKVKTYNWAALLNSLYLAEKKKKNELFASGATYILIATSSNGVHSYTYKMNLRVGGVTYGGVPNRYRVSNLKSVNGPWHGRCGRPAFTNLNNDQIGILGNACNERIHLFITQIGANG